MDDVLLGELAKVENEIEDRFKRGSQVKNNFPNKRHKNAEACRVVRKFKAPASIHQRDHDY